MNWSLDTLIKHYYRKRVYKLQNI